MYIQRHRQRCRKIEQDREGDKQKETKRMRDTEGTRKIEIKIM